MLRFINVIIFVFIISILLPLGQTYVQAETDEDKKESVAEALKKQDKENAKDDTTETPFPIDKNDNLEVVDSQFGFLDFFNVLFALFLVLMLLFVTLKFIKKKNQTYGLTKNMMNLGGTSLGGNRSVQLVKIGDRILVVGVGEDIQLLKEIDSKEEVQQILSEQQRDYQQMLQPSDILSKVVQQLKELKKDKNGKQDSFKSILANQLSDLSKGRKKLMQELDQKGNKRNE